VVKSRSALQKALLQLYNLNSPQPFQNPLQLLFLLLLQRFPKAPAMRKPASHYASILTVRPQVSAEMASALATVMMLLVPLNAAMPVTEMVIVIMENAPVSESLG